MNDLELGNPTSPQPSERREQAVQYKGLCTVTPAWGHSLGEDAEPVVTPLTDPRCRAAGFAGPEVALLARLRDRFQVPPTLVAIGRATGWRSPDWPSLLPELGGNATIRGWLAGPGHATRQVGPVWHNIVPDAVDESVVELAGLAARAAADRHRTAYVVVTLQCFVPADVSVTVTVEAPGSPVRLRSRWGVAESPGGDPQPDVTVLSWPDLQVTEHRVVHQATAVAAAAGGTQIVEVPPRMRGKPGLGTDQARHLSRICGGIVSEVGSGLEFDLAIADRTPYLLACRCL